MPLGLLVASRADCAFLEGCCLPQGVLCAHAGHPFSVRAVWADRASESLSTSSRSAKALRTWLPFLQSNEVCRMFQVPSTLCLASPSSSEEAIRLVGGQDLVDGRMAFPSQAFAAWDYFTPCRLWPRRIFLLLLVGSSTLWNFCFFLAAPWPQGIRSFFFSSRLFCRTGFSLYISFLFVCLFFERCQFGGTSRNSTALNQTSLALLGFWGGGGDNSLRRLSHFFIGRRRLRLSTTSFGWLTTISSIDLVSGADGGLLGQPHLSEERCFDAGRRCTYVSCPFPRLHCFGQTELLSLRWPLQGPPKPAGHRWLFFLCPTGSGGLSENRRLFVWCRWAACGGCWACWGTLVILKGLYLFLHRFVPHFKKFRWFFFQSTVILLCRNRV